jgi:hypothetical protein
MTRTITTRIELAAAAAVAGNGDASAKLRHELLALAMLADIQAQPEHAEAIALDFDHWCLAILSASQGELTVRQRALLNALDAYFDELGREGDETLWSEAAIRDSLEWGDIRGLARQALESFGWRGQDLVLDGNGLEVAG